MKPEITKPTYKGIPTKLFAAIVVLIIFASVSFAAEPARTASRKAVIVFKSGATLAAEFTSGTIVNIEGHFRNVRPDDQPKEYSYSLGGTNSTIIVDLKEVVAIKIGPS